MVSLEKGSPDTPDRSDSESSVLPVVQPLRAGRSIKPIAPIRPIKPVKPIPPIRPLSEAPRRSSRLERAQDNDDEGLFARFIGTCINWWQDDNRPGLIDLHVRYLPGVVLTGTLLVGGADDMLNLHIADRMATVKVEPHSNEVVRDIQQVVHDIGVQAKQAEK